MKRLKILFVITDLAKGGAERFLLDLVTELENYPEIEYRIASLYDRVEYEEFTINSRMHILNYSTFSFRKKAKNKAYSDLLDEFQPDIIHSHRYFGEFITSYDVRKDIKYICHGHDNIIQFMPFSLKTLMNREKFLNYLEFQFLKLKKYSKVPTYFIANSKHTLDYFTSHVPNKQKSKVRLIQYGFNYEKFRSEKTPSKSSKIKLLNIGSYQLKKNQSFLLDIAEELKNRNIDFEINLIGTGEEYQNIEKRIIEKQLEAHVFQRGLQSNVERWYKDSNLYIHSATYEPFGLVFLEAMAAGLPIITLDGKGNRDIIEQDKNGFIFYEQDAEKFADKIIEYASDETKYGQISAYAQEYSKQFDASLKMKEMVEFYKSILASE